MATVAGLVVQVEPVAGVVGVQFQVVQFQRELLVARDKLSEWEAAAVHRQLVQVAEQTARVQVDRAARVKWEEMVALAQLAMRTVVVAAAAIAVVVVAAEILTHVAQTVVVVAAAPPTTTQLISRQRPRLSKEGIRQTVQ